MGLLSNLWSILGGLLASGNQVRKEVKQATGFQYIRCLYFTSGRMWDLPGTYDKERSYVTPKNVNQSFKVTQVFYDDKGSPFVVCFQKNHRTIDFVNPPKAMPESEIVELIKKNDEAKIESSDLKNKESVIDSVSLARFEIPGARELAQDAEALINRVDLRVIQGVSKLHIVLIVLIGLLVGWIIGAVMAGVGVLSITVGNFAGP